ncbi:hypothetical protein HDN1F_00300 [gamma proteobacterium HdN1]|nr:hypothetical protein HDN1F_00300 [gamma proteobacterium HdN1]
MHVQSLQTLARHKRTSVFLAFLLFALFSATVAGMLGVLTAPSSAALPWFEFLHRAGAACLGASLLLASQPFLNIELRGTLRWFALACLAYGSASTLDTLSQGRLTQTLIEPYNLLHLLTGLLITAGIAHWGWPQLDRLTRRTVVLDTATLLAATLTISFLWHSPLAEQISPNHIISDLVYPLTLALPVVFGLVLTLTLRTRIHWSYVAVFFGCSALAILHANAWLQILTHNLFTQQMSRIGESAALLLIAGAASKLQLNASYAPQTTRLYSKILRGIPTIIVVFTCIGAMQTLLAHNSSPEASNIVIAGTALTLLFAMTRQSDILNEHNRLLYTEKALREEELHYQALLESSTDGILVWLDGRIVDCNHTAPQLFGISRNELIGKSVYELSPELQASGELSEEQAQKLFVRGANAQKLSFEWRHTRGDGTAFDAEITLRQLGSNKQRFISVTRDISERKNAEREIRHQTQLLQATLDATPGIFMVINPDGQLIEYNAQFLADLEYTSEEAKHLRISDFCSPEDCSKVAKTIEQILTDSNSSEANTNTLEIRLTTKHGQTFPVLLSTSRAISNSEKHIVAIAVDISVRKLLENELQEFQTELVHSNNSLRLLNLLSSRLNAISDISEIAWETIEVLRILGKSDIGMFYLANTDENMLDLLAYNGELQDTEIEPYRQTRLQNTLSGLAIQSGNVLHLSEVLPKAQEFPLLSLLLKEHQIGDGVLIPLHLHQRVIGTIALFFHTPRQQQLQDDTLEAIGKTVSLAITNARHLRELEHQANHDNLTHLPNRQVLHERFASALNANPSPRRMALMLLDLNRFKEINDTMGHHAGDLLLQQTSRRLARIAETYHVLACRLGGDEFTLLMPTYENQQEVLTLAENVANTLRHPLLINGQNVQICASIGVALYPDHGHDSHTLLRAADTAMYRAKRQGADIVLYQAQDQYSPEQLSIATALNQAIEGRELVLHYQPKIALNSKTITGMEALVRWQHPTLGFLYPESFVPVAEQGEAIHKLTYRILDMALAQQKEWKRLGYRISVAVNLSTRSLANERILEMLSELLDKHGAVSGDLEVEITEAALMQDPDFSAKLLHDIADMGVALSIDNFGIGFSSLSHLRHLPISTLKIDRKFVQKMLDNDLDALMVRSTIGLAHNLNMTVIAGGVEDDQTCTKLELMGCDVVQGHFLTQPRTWPDLCHWLDESYLELAKAPHSPSQLH